jgi:hypothetical protein
MSRGSVPNAPYANHPPTSLHSHGGEAALVIAGHHLHDVTKEVGRSNIADAIRVEISNGDSLRQLERQQTAGSGIVGCLISVSILGGILRLTRCLA